jgi:hypothetical protein
MIVDTDENESCFLFHNFIRINQVRKDECHENDAEEPNHDVDDDPGTITSKAWRDGIAYIM